MFKKYLSLILALIIMFSLLTVLPVEVTAKEVDISDESANLDLAESGAITQTEYNNKIASLMSQYENGSSWKGSFDGGYQCYGFARLIAYNVFGSHVNDWPVSYSWGGIKAGDVVQYGNTTGYGHTIFVLSVSGNTISFVDCNGNGNGVDAYGNWIPDACGIKWDNTITIGANIFNSYSFSYRYVSPGVGYNPESALDSVSGGLGSVHVSGWCFDRDDLTQPLYVHVYVGGGSGTAGAEGTSIYANIAREDVDRVYNVGAFHGFDAVVPTSKSGNQEVYIYAINIGSGESTEIGHRTVYISPDTEKPKINDCYLSLVTQDTYRVCVLPEDNVGIKSVRIATWTQADQSDLIWHDASFNGTYTYFVDIKRSDYSTVKNSFYYNHIYVYDYANNYVSIACDKDYKITSDTGRSVPEGEYRIVTAVNENRALDVADGSAENNANIQIYANFVSPKQTFILSYIDNGFYHISNSYSGRLLDVYGDTYVNNTNVIQHENNGGANQEWMIKPSDDGYYYIISRTNGLALDVTNADDRDRANVAVHTQNQSTAQKWKLRRVLKEDMLTVKDVTIKSDTDEIVPEITVKVDDNIVSQDNNYQVRITTDIESGKGAVTVTGINNFCDSVTKEFNIIMSPTVHGDLDGNGKADVVDATFVQRYATGIPVPYTDEQMLCCDIDGSGKADVVDATFIQRYATGIPTPYDIGKAI